MTKLKRQRGDVSELCNNIVALARLLRQSASVDSETWTGLMTLGAIQRAEGHATPTQIALALGLRSSNLAQVLGELDEHGLILRTPDPNDKRKVRLSLTEAGIALVRETRAKRDGWLADAMAANMSPQEQAQLIAVGELMRRLTLSGHNRP